MGGCCQGEDPNRHNFDLTRKDKYMKVEQGGRKISGFGHAVIRNEVGLNEESLYEFRLKKT